MTTCREHSHSNLYDGPRHWTVPTFQHTHEYTDPSHYHNVDENKDLIPPHVLSYWKNRT